ncbi:efflux RND transporter permease subunit [Alteromonas sediminis]|uniref:Efflux RND transporter permease subunit n=1 Tax=Alteromonas sediminis TaxID=2259342 RepID=A0A3N5Y054_9ALTE|nr:efflux RND transporter permease subunit [Alteromonas sediminis]RPJ66390.1 efflux RND transporter permease subunit [Alteromonas sediminis]
MGPYLFFRHGHLLALSILVILVAGISALTNLPRLEDPRIDLRFVIVQTVYPGASAERVEALVTDVIEDELREVSEIKELRSTSQAGFSSIVVEMQDWVDNSTNQQIFSKVRDKVDQAAQRFPEGVGEPFVDDKRDPIAYTLLTAIKPKASSAMTLPMVSRLSEELADRLRNVPGTEVVRFFGAPVEEVKVAIDVNQLAMAGLTINQVSAMIAQADPKLPAGAIYSEDYNIRIQVSDTLDAVSTIKSIPLINNAGQVLRLGDIAVVEKGWQTPESEIVLVDGERAINVAARIVTTVRVDVWTEQALAVVEAFNTEFSGSVDVDVIFEQSQYTEMRLAELTQNLLMGCAVVMAVIFLFMGLKASLIVGLALPLCASFALFSLGFFGEQIHQMTIFGIIIAIGLLIDNAIVITDEIRLNLLRPELSRQEAMSKSVSHLLAPLTASTLTTILGFMPIFLLIGNIGDFVGPIAVSVVMALLGSLFISLTIIAALAALFLPRHRNEQVHWLFKGVDTPGLSAAFKKALLIAVQKPKRVTMSIVLFCLSGFILSSQLGNVFFPAADRDQFEIYLWTNDGSAIDKTFKRVTAVDNMIGEYDGIKQVTWMLGGSTAPVYYNQILRVKNKANYANAVVTVTDPTRAESLVRTLQADLQQAFPDLKLVVREFSQGPPIEAPIEIEIFGPDLEVLDQLGKQVRLAMSQLPGITQSVASVSFSEPEYSLDVTRDVAAQAGTSLTGVASQLQSALSGKVMGSILENTEEIPVRVRLGDGQRANLAVLGSLPVSGYSEDGQSHYWATVDSIGELSLQPSVTSISREDGARLNRVHAYLLPDYPAIDVSNQLREILNETLELPAGYRLKFAGDADEQQRAIGQLATYLPVLLVLMVTTLILTFSSVRLATVIGSVAMLSVGLGFFSLWLSGLPIGFNPLLGSAGLIGVTINGSIVVIAAIKANKRARRGDLNAIVEETMSCSRHILSTTLTTVGGLVPLLLFSEGSFWPPLAVVLAGGVGFSVILSLLFTPAVVAWLANSKKGL